ncbi:LpqB family beta-propeller domain-containing protein [Plantactinospora siamensis]|uniref:LpqB family beta-propeller domain-containing protein n=1 Tax=Plantactinospora siamensis TaxID=555372 RepID=A0ABV6NV22_9ACTN
MTRRRLVALVAALALGAGIAGCGIPADTDVKVDGPGPPPLAGTAGGDDAEPPGAKDTTVPGEFVHNFLLAPAGEAGTTAVYDRVNGYLAPGRHRSKPPGEVKIMVVRPTQLIPEDVQGGPNGIQVKVPVLPVGVLDADGTIAPPPAGAPTSYTFTLIRVARDDPSRADATQLAIENPPPGLVMSTEALSNYYQARSVYFWSADGAALVPEQRYLPRTVPAERRATEVAGWLNDGPADWLRPAAQPLPDGLRLTGNVAESDDVLSINISATTGGDAQEGQLRQLETQLAWSMRDLGASQFQLRLRNSSRPPVLADERRRLFPLYALDGHEQRFCVYNGQIRALSGAPAEQPPPAVPVRPEQNRGIDSAGVLRVGAGVAVAVVTGTAGRYRLATGLGPGQVELKHTSQSTYASMSRPVWLKGPDPAHPLGLVVAAGRLYRFGVDGRLTAVPVPATSGAVTAVAAALDGRRLAVIVGGAVSVVPLTVDGAALTLGDARQVPSSLSSPTALDWVGENDLVVAGTRAGQSGTIDQISIDGAVSIGQLLTAGAPVTRMTAYPENPLSSSLVSRYMYEVNGQGWANRFSNNVRIPAGDVVGDAIAGAVPRAPFFLY